MESKTLLSGIIIRMDILIKALAFVAPVVVILLFVLPSYLSIIRQRGILGILTLVFLCVYVLGVMSLSVKTGVPFGHFTYDSALGYKLFGLVPWLIVVVYPSLLLAAFWLASKFTHSAGRVALATIFALLIGLTIDPIMVKLELWAWESPGFFYGVPPVSFAGWLLTSLVGSSLLHVMWNQEASVFRGLAYSGLLLILFWTGANIGVQQWVPAAIGGVIGGLILLLAGIERWSNSRTAE